MKTWLKFHLLQNETFPFYMSFSLVKSPDIFFSWLCHLYSKSKPYLSSCHKHFNSVGDYYMYNYTHWHAEAGMYTGGDVSEPFGISRQDMTFTFTVFISPWRRPVCMPTVGDWVWLTTDWLVFKTCVCVCERQGDTANISTLSQCLVLKSEHFCSNFTYFQCK